MRLLLLASTLAMGLMAVALIKLELVISADRPSAVLTEAVVLRLQVVLTASALCPTAVSDSPGVLSSSANA